MRHSSASADATAAFAGRVAPLVKPPLRLYLSGALGAGKTFFAQALLAALGERGRVRSPSYALVYTYCLGAFTAHHFDCYRLQGEAIGADLLELLEEDALCLLEWPEQASGLPDADIRLHFEHRGDSARRISGSAHSASGQALLAQLA